MSAESPEKPPVPKGPAKLPYAWLTLALGFGVLVTAGVFAGILLFRFMSIRPMDLRGYSDAVAQSVEDVLLENRIPSANIQREPKGLTSDRAAIWRFYTFDVLVPDPLTLDGCQELLRRVLQRQDATLTATDQGTHRELSVYMGNHRFVTLNLRPETPRVAAPAVPPPAAATATPENQEAPLENAPPSAESLAAASKIYEDPPVQLPTLAQAIKDLDLSEILSIALPKEEELTLESEEVGGAEQSTPHETPPSTEKPKPDTAPTSRVAIILDDGGYGGPVPGQVMALDTNLTLAILPNTPHATTLAKDAKEKGFEILLHMPMEKVTFPGRISTDMTKEQIDQLFENALNQVPGAVGVNNHAGSKFTTDEAAMDRFMECLKPTGLFFIDSRTTAKTVGCARAAAAGIRTAQRDIFLDHKATDKFIRTQFALLIKRAKDHGQAIAIGHFRPNTVRLLAELLPKLKENNIQLVHVSEFVK